MASGLCFGVEIELLVRPRDNTDFRRKLNQAGWDEHIDSSSSSGSHLENVQLEALRDRNRRALRTSIAGVLSMAPIPASPGTYHKWRIVDDTSLVEISTYWRIEVVSRTLSTGVEWQQELAMVLDVLHDICNIRLTPDCSMHVHLSPRSSDFTSAQLRGICKGLCYFDDAITRVVPAERKATHWAVSNIQGRGSGVSQKLKRLYSSVPSKSWTYLFKKLDRVTPNSVHETLSANDSRYLSWNFRNVTRDCGTVEFRRPPGVDSAKKARHWVAFTLGFIAQAMATDWASFESLKSVGTVVGLRTFIIDGLSKLEPESQGALNEQMLKEDTSPLATSEVIEWGTEDKKRY